MCPPGRQGRAAVPCVARQRLCLRATIDYWVTPCTGNPSQAIEKLWEELNAIATVSIATAPSWRCLIWYASAQQPPLPCPEKPLSCPEKLRSYKHSWYSLDRLACFGTRFLRPGQRQCRSDKRAQRVLSPAIGASRAKPWLGYGGGRSPSPADEDLIHTTTVTPAVVANAAHRARRPEAGDETRPHIAQPAVRAPIAMRPQPRECTRAGNDSGDRFRRWTLRGSFALAPEERNPVLRSL